MTYYFLPQDVLVENLHLYKGLSKIDWASSGHVQHDSVCVTSSVI